MCALTIISSVLTFISIICTIVSILNAKKAHQYKEEVVVLKDTIEVKGIVESFKNARLKFLQETRLDDWFKGIDINLVISPMERTLNDITTIYSLINDSTELKQKVSDVLLAINRYDRCKKKEKQDIIAELGDIDNLLHEILQKQTAKVIE